LYFIHNYFLLRILVKMRIFSLSVKFVIYIEYKVVFNFMQEKSELF
jgi:hypothetical protein